MPDNQLKCVCIACRKEMQNIMEGHGIQPSGGVAFATQGHYGSTVFDPMDGTTIEICVCDDCLKNAIGVGQVWTTLVIVTKTFEVKQWTGDEPRGEILV